MTNLTQASPFAAQEGFLVCSKARGSLWAWCSHRAAWLPTEAPCISDNSLLPHTLRARMGRAARLHPFQRSGILHLDSQCGRLSFTNKLSET